ncbi:unnamed protein product [Sphenostylis stenocarpa]|uniref:Protein kinase domain-containing protein n=1 Tax=Sphenostylis stenocarpa TaxID=92480 RepID=A0AA86VEN0_9FABA|nr:unnamed protein product [Sphenostylis stenocarpa]
MQLELVKRAASQVKALESWQPHVWGPLQKNVQKWEYPSFGLISGVWVKSNPQPCGYLGEIYFPFTTSPDPKCGWQIRGCDNLHADKEFSLTGHNWHKIETIFFPPTFHLNYLSIFIRPDIDAEFAPELLEKPFVNNFSFSGCSWDSHDYKSQIPSNISEMTLLYTHCPHHDIYFSSTPVLSSSMPISILLPFACLLTTRTCPSYTFLFSILEIKLNIPESCSYCYPPLCKFRFEEGKGLVCFHDDGPKSTEPPTDMSKPPTSQPATSKARDRGTEARKMQASKTYQEGLTLLPLELQRPERVDVSTLGSLSSPMRSSKRQPTILIKLGSLEKEALELFTTVRDSRFSHPFALTRIHPISFPGILRDGREVAVKRLIERNYRPVESFINEIQILKGLRHRNLVCLHGCTSRNGRELLLVYEYIPNGSVSSHLHGDRANSRLLSWPLRMKIAIETARALAYLHASVIIHRDVKTSNILLDNEFGVKVSDFGLSRLFPDDVTHVSTVPRGTPGYVDPDYRLCYQLTKKSDVYSFGVVLVELISSLKAVDMNRDREDIKLANLALRKIQKGSFCELVDPSLGFQSDEKVKSMIGSVAELASHCLQGDKDLRPSMDEVLLELERIHSGRDEPPNPEEIVVHPRASQSYAHLPRPNTVMSPQHLRKTH